MRETLHAVPQPPESETLGLDTESLNEIPFAELALAAADFLAGPTAGYKLPRQIRILWLNDEGRHKRKVEVSSSDGADEHSQEGSVIVKHEVTYSGNFPDEHGKMRYKYVSKVWGIIIPREDTGDMKGFYTHRTNAGVSDIGDNLYELEPRDISFMKGLLIEGLQTKRPTLKIPLPSDVKMRGILATLDSEQPSAQSA